MLTIRPTEAKNQHRIPHEAEQTIPLDDGTVTTPVTVGMIQPLPPLGLNAVKDALLSEVAALAGRRYAPNNRRPELVRWGAQRGSIYLADQKLPIRVPRVRDRQVRCEVPLPMYAAPEAFRLARSAMS